MPTLRTRAAAALLAAASPTLAGGLPVTLLAPTDGAELMAGGVATVEWAPLPGGSLGEADEWEAFLSLDGGAFYAVRLTPHLHLDLRRFTFRVPDTPTRGARLLLRFGDERREVGFEMPQRFAIRPSPVPLPQSSRLAPSRGEAGRPGDPGVVAWLDGSRAGRALASLRVPTSDSRALPHLQPLQHRRCASTLPRPPALAGARVAARLAGTGLASPAPPSRRPPVPASPILRLACRQNE